MNSNDLREKLIIPAVVGALYAALTMLLAPISYGNLQFRISEALCVLPVFFPYTSVGLFLGCALANMISAAGILDVVFGSLATLCAGLCAAACGREARRTGAMPSAAMRVLACLSPVVWNGVVIGAVLAWSFARDAFWQSFLLFGAEVALGEAGVLFLLGMPLISLIPRIFHLERKRACCLFREEHPDADRYEVTLFGSLALTGRGHLTDVAVRDALAPMHTDILWNTERTDLPHPNTMELRAYKNGALTGEMTALSVGGGAISIPGRPDTESPEVYPETSYAEISAFCSANRLRLSDYVFLREGEKIRDYLYDIWNTMKQSVSDGLTRTGELPGGLEVERKAQYLYNRRHIDESPQTRENRLVCAYAFAVAEQNASGGEIVTAPTCGASGVMPAALLYMQEERGFSDEAIVRALAAGGVIGDLIKTNASISGAECGCQAEIGSACSMTAAALGELFEMGLGQIGYAAEVAMEHHLGLTCDPIGGLVQIPCIERNAVAAMRAINALSLANFLSETSKISFDTVVHTMYETGRDLNRVYRETAEGGLAKNYHPEK